MRSFVNKNFFSIVLFLILLSTLLLVLPGIFKNTDIRKRAASTTANFQIYPANEVFQAGETKTFQVKATFSDAPAGETIDYLRMTISFPKDYFKVPDNSYVINIFSGQQNLQRILRIDGPVISNQNGQIIVETAAATPGSGPATSGPETFVSFNLTAIKDSPTTLPISVDISQLVSNSSVNLTTTSTPATVQVGTTGISLNPTDTVIPTVVNCNHSNGDANCDGTIDAADFDIWVREFSGQINTTRSDFNSSGKINLVDFEIWRRNTTGF